MQNTPDTATIPDNPDAVIGCTDAPTATYLLYSGVRPLRASVTDAKVCLSFPATSYREARAIISSGGGNVEPRRFSWIMHWLHSQFFNTAYRRTLQQRGGSIELTPDDCQLPDYLKRPVDTNGGGVAGNG